MCSFRVLNCWIMNIICILHQQDCLTKTSQPNEYPLEETSLLQLQEVMEQVNLNFLCFLYTTIPPFTSSVFRV